MGRRSVSNKVITTVDGDESLKGNLSVQLSFFWKFLPKKAITEELRKSGLLHLCF